MSTTTLRKLTIAAAGGAMALTGALASTTASATEPQEPSACAPDQVQTTVERGDSGMGHSSKILRVKNTSNTTCSVFGHPVVTARDANGVQLGAVSTPQQGSADSMPIDLKPGQSSTASIIFATPGNFPAETCRPAEMSELRIADEDPSYSFDFTTAQKGSICTNPEMGQMRTTPFTF